MSATRDADNAKTPLRRSFILLHVYITLKCPSKLPSPRLKKSVLLLAPLAHKLHKTKNCTSITSLAFQLHFRQFLAIFLYDFCYFLCYFSISGNFFHFICRFCGFFFVICTVYSIFSYIFAFSLFFFSFFLISDYFL